MTRKASTIATSTAPKPASLTAAHTPGPWEVREFSAVDDIRSTMHGTVAQVHTRNLGIDPIQALSERHSNARRIVACVNACDGIPDRILCAGPMSVVPGITLKSVMEGAEALRSQVKALEADRLALRRALGEVNFRVTQAKITSTIGKGKDRTEFLRGELERISEQARAALAKVPT